MLNVSPQTIDELVVAVADALVARLAAVLSPGVAGEEPWQLLSEEDAADRLGRSPSWLRTRARQGEMPFVKLDGGGRMYLLADLQAFAESRRVGPDGGAVLEGRLRLARDPAAGAASRVGDQVRDRRVEP